LLIGPADWFSVTPVYNWCAHHTWVTGESDPRKPAHEYHCRWNPVANET